MAIEKIELSDAIQSLATQSTVDSLVGSLSGEAANISAANLATVVAGMLKNPLTTSSTYLKSTHDANNLTSNAIYSFYEESGIPQNMPDVTRGLLLVVKSIYNVAQLIFEYKTATMYYRILNSTIWGSWIKVAKG